MFIFSLNKTLKLFIWLAALILFQVSYSLAGEQPLSVVIIGAGPAGLAAAIEAHTAGADVTLVEKRDAYTRNQWLFLFESSLQLLRKWDITLSFMTIATLSREHLYQGVMGITTIKSLEEGLSKRVEALNIKRIKAEFKELKEKQVVIKTTDSELVLSYDILVGADGAHSQVRTLLEVKLVSFGSAVARAAFIARSDMSDEAEIPCAKRQQDYFVKRILIPQGSIIIVQYPLSDSKDSQIAIEVDTLEEIAQNNNWYEGTNLNEAKAVITEEILITLQQAQSFINSDKSIILVGDSATTAPFCQARGANTALQAATLVGKFFKEFTHDKEAAYSNFNNCMKEITDELINDSRYLISVAS